MATTGERIREARLRAGMTQSELAEMVGVKFSAIHKYEKGLVVNLKRETILALARALDVRPSYLLCADEDDVQDSHAVSRKPRSGYSMGHARASDLRVGAAGPITEKHKDEEDSRPVKKPKPGYYPDPDPDPEPDEDIVILSRAAKRMSPEDRQKLIEMAKVVFGDAFKE